CAPAASARRPACTRCGTATPPTCWRAAPTWPPCRSCWATTRSPPPCVTPTSANGTCNAPSVRWILCRACPPAVEVTDARPLPGRRSHPRRLRGASRIPLADGPAARGRRGTVGLPHGGIGRADRGVLLLRRARVPVQLLPQQALPEVSGRLPGR